MASSSFLPQKKHQVFLSFRGEDTRHNFTSHLLKALEESRIQVFFDDKELKKGEEISPELLKAIIASKISIVILSKDYASSRVSLAELSQIMDCKRTKGLIVLPIFYHVNPSDVGKNGGSFRESFDEHLLNKPDEINKWRVAFTEEPAYIKEIVQVVIEKLNSKSPRGCKDQLVGIDDQKKEIISLLCIPQEETRIIGIWGMGGIGKTTLAQATYDEVSIQFDSCCFLQNVRQKFEKQGMESLRDDFLSRVLKQEIHIDTPLIGSNLIQDRLRIMSVFVVLDDVSDYDQIEGLGVKHFGLGSKILLTSRNSQVLKTGVDEIYKVERLNYNCSLQLFSKFAFQQDKTVVGFHDLSYNFAKYAGGVPLALKVLGCALYQKPREYRKSTLDKLKEYPDRKFFNILKISFDGLDALEKNIFLDIACFFQWESKERVTVTEILNSCYKGASCGISNLVDKCLLDSTLGMHDLLREMGWEIVRQESKEPGKHSRLSMCVVLKNNKLCPTIFNKMVNLRIINFYSYSYKNGEFRLLLSDEALESLPDELRYLHWDYCRLKSFPSNFSPENLVELNLTNCNIEQLWNGD
ncbi:hypothetical protein DITRI_Ditri11bG0025200 [Diplodiscus trichospermus]